MFAINAFLVALENFDDEVLKKIGEIKGTGTGTGTGSSSDELFKLETRKLWTSYCSRNPDLISLLIRY